jgi:hypothetical protein
MTMSLAAAVSLAVRNALYNDNKAFDASQVMNQPPYSFDTPGKIRDLLLDVAHGLATDVPPILLNIDKMNFQSCMNDTVIKFEGEIIDAFLEQNG